MKKNGLRLIAIGIALSNDERIKKVKLLNEMIDDTASTIRSASDNDGMPHGSSVGDTVGERVSKIEELEYERNLEQERINAFDWGLQCAKDIVDDKDCALLQEAIITSLRGNNGDALNILADSSVKQNTFYRAKSIFITQILSYLHFNLK